MLAKNREYTSAYTVFTTLLKKVMELFKKKLQNLVKAIKEHFNENQEESGTEFIPYDYSIPRNKDNWYDYIKTSLNWGYETVNWAYNYLYDLAYPQNYPPTDSREYDIWVAQNREKVINEEFQATLSERKKKINAQYKRDVERINSKKKVCNQWHSDTKRDFNTKKISDENIYVNTEDRIYPQKTYNWEPNMIEHDAYQQRLCRNLICKSNLKSTDTTQIRPRLSSPETINSNDNIISQNQQLNECRSELDDMRALYKATENEIKEYQSSQIRGLSRKKLASPINDMPMPLINAPEEMRPTLPRNFNGFSSIPWMTKATWSRILFELPFHLALGNVAQGKGFFERHYVRFVQAVMALVLVGAYWFILTIFFQMMTSCVLLADKSMNLWQENRQEDYVYRVKQSRAKDRDRRRAFSLNFWGRKIKSLSHETLELVNKLPKRVKRDEVYKSRYKKPFKDRGGYIPPFPNLSLLSPKSYVGLTTFEREQILFMYDPIHLLIRLKELTDEIEEILTKLETSSKRKRIKKTIRKFSIRKIKRKVVKITGLLLFTTTATFGAWPQAIPKKQQSPQPAIQHLIKSDKASNNSIIMCENAALEQTLLEIEEAEKLITRNQNRKKKMKKFNRKIHSLSDLPLQDENSELESPKSYVLQRHKSAKIKIN